MRVQLTVLAALLLLSPFARAEVLEASDGGFSVRNSVTVKAASEEVWATMTGQIAEWWNPDHSWSADAGNLYMDAKLGGCFCEHLPATGGSVEHLRIIYFSPGQEIRFDGALGPLQGMATGGRMIWTIEGTGEGTRITFTYKVHGWAEGGLAGIAPAVDGVIRQQLERLAERVDSTAPG